MQNATYKAPHYSFLQPPVTFILLGPNIPLSTSISNTLSLHSPLEGEIRSPPPDNSMQNDSFTYFHLQFADTRNKHIHSEVKASFHSTFTWLSIQRVTECREHCNELSNPIQHTWSNHHLFYMHWQTLHCKWPKSFICNFVILWTFLTILSTCWNYRGSSATLQSCSTASCCTKLQHKQYHTNSPAPPLDVLDIILAHATAN